MIPAVPVCIRATIAILLMTVAIGLATVAQMVLPEMVDGAPTRAKGVRR